MVKIEVELPVPVLNNLVVRLENERCPSNYDIHASPEQYIEEIGLADYIGVALGHGGGNRPRSESDHTFSG